MREWAWEGRSQEITADHLEGAGYRELAAGHRRCSMNAWRRAAEMGDPSAQYGYTWRLINKEKPITQARVREAYHWLRQAAARGDENAAEMLRWEIFRGTGRE